MSKVINIVRERGKAAFEDAIRDTKYGDSIVYHVGTHAAGPHREAAMNAQLEGYVSLVQKKLNPKLFEYKAQRRKKKVKKKTV